MKIVKISAVSALLVFGALNQANAAEANLSIGATVVDDLAVSVTGELSFGSFLSSASAKTVDVSANYLAPVTSNSIPSHQLTAGTAAQVTITGTPDVVISYSMPDTARITVGNDYSPIAMDLTLNNSTGLNTNVVPLAGGSLSFDIGGTLSVAANQPAGFYDGTVVITAQYQ